MQWRMVTALVVGAVVLSGGARGARAQMPPMRTFGTVTVNGQPAALGTAVQALVDDKVCGEGVVRRISDDLPVGYVVDVIGAAQTPGCAGDGTRIRFRVGGADAKETAVFDTGTFLRLDLTVSGQVATPSPGPTPPPFSTATSPSGAGGASPTATAASGTPPAGSTTPSASAGATVSPTAGAAGPAQPTSSPAGGTAQATATATAPPIFTASPATSSTRTSDNGGSSALIWLTLVIVVLAAAGAAGYVLYRRRA